MGLTLKRKPGQRVLIGDVTVTMERWQGTQAVLTIDAPAGTVITRGEWLDAEAAHERLGGLAGMVAHAAEQAGVVTARKSPPVETAGEGDGGWIVWYAFGHDNPARHSPPFAFETATAVAEMMGADPMITTLFLVSPGGRVESII